MELVAVAAVAALVVAYGLVSKRLKPTPISGPMVFVAAGLLLGQPGLGLLSDGLDRGVLRVLAEATLILVLFTDAIGVDLRIMRRQAAIPGRLLGLGLPLTLAAGTVVALAVFGEFDIWHAALLAAILTPTDAALGKAVVESSAVPRRIRQALNVESGLNDGLMMPIITILIALAATEAGEFSPGSGAIFAVRQIGFGVAFGGAIGWLGGRLLDRAVARDWVEGVFIQLVTLAIGVGAWAAADIAGGNGFVAAFVAGVAFGHTARPHCKHAHDFATDEGQLLILLTFAVFGAALLGPALDAFDWRITTYAVASLTVVRMLPVGLALMGSGLSPPTHWFIGWFGPRGLASILFGLFVLEEADLPLADQVLDIAAWVVFASVVLHGATASSFANRYGRWVAARPDIPETAEVEEMPGG